MLGCLLIIIYNGTVQTGYILESFLSHTSSLHHHSRIQQQLDKLTDEKSLLVAIPINPLPILGIRKDTVMCIIIWLTWVPIFKLQFSSAAGINPRTSFCINTNPSRFLLSKDNKGFIIDLVIEILGVRFKKSSCCESIHGCRFTHSLRIIVSF